eukprot:TRINITY_DN7292_c0_g1_i2.p1 TRINITY_DN7292_c0_g1~~TRINITY_DN7292_c0_g1_i2.p1  ORF type:complete len:440 (+),score=74.56 TRINITY_DN7292_c0_g1_i2:122-1441(+)
MSKASHKLATGQTAIVEIIYCPLTMTSDKNEHKGSVFFAQPDGGGLLFNLVGISIPPLATNHITRIIPSKTPYSQMLPVQNWLQQPQRFKATIEIDNQDPSVSLKGLDYIDVPALGERQFKVNFFSFKEGVVNCKVIFTNESTKEYSFYTLSFTTTAPNILETIELETPTRRLISHNITLDNPLPNIVTFNLTCDNEDMTFPSSVSCNPGSQIKIEISYLPLIAKEATGRLTISSPQLGIYLYDLKLKSTSAGNERAIHYKAGLGSKQVQAFRFINFVKAKTEYHCSVDNEDFLVDKSIIVPSGSGGNEVVVDICYEPSKLGDSKANLKIFSEIGGEFNCCLFGHCTLPQPQGPIIIKGGSTINVPIFNPFFKPTNFSFNLDNSHFSVKPNEINIPPKKSSSISLSFKNGPSATATGKLTVVSEENSAPWIYYLKGVSP